MNYKFIVLTGIQKKIVLAPQNAEGGPALFFGVPSWQSSGDSTIALAADGLSAILTPGPTASATTFTITSQGDPEVGKKVITTVIEIDVILEEATQAGVTLEDVLA